MSEVATMQTAVETLFSKQSTSHATFLANVSRHFISLDIDSMLEAVGHAAVRVLGDVCAIDRIANAAATRILEVRTSPTALLESAGDLAALTRGELRIEGARSRISVPIGAGVERFGTLSFVRHDGRGHDAADLALAQELADRMALAIANARRHATLSDALTDRERLISIAAHELRGPLCSVRLGLQALRRGRFPPKATRLVDIMLREEQRLTQLIEDLLDLGRIRSGQLQLRLAAVDLGAVVREVGGQLRLTAARTGSTLTLSLPRPPVVGQWDRSRLEQVVTNLVGNAIKYGEGRPIHVRVTAPDARGVVRLEVADRGMGIEPAQQDRIFEPFKRVSATAHHDGLGLGLYIVRKIVEQLGGAVRVDSRPRLGSTFVVELPVDLSH
jgi:signal transduction histidine kinase